MVTTEELLRNAQRYASEFRPPDSVPHSAQVAVVACMDVRLDVYRILGLRLGDAHVIRNAGGAVTDDAIRSLTISQRLLGTREIILMHHSDCGMTTFTDEALKARLLTETGIRPPWSPEAFADVEADVRQSLARIAASPFIPYKDRVRGFVYRVEDGTLTEVRP
jgi:carbonic anhydrase